MPTAQRRQPGTTKAERRRQRAAAALEVARRRERRRKMLIGTGITAGVLAVGIVIAVIVVNTGGSAHTNAQTAPTPATAPTWPAPAPAQVPAAVKAAGLPLLTMEATDVHYHAHLDVIVDGQPVQVPGQIGIAGQTAISSMHTHDPTGIIHIESPTNATFTLGQFFTEWQVRLSPTCLNNVCATSDKTWHFYVNGQPYTGDPASIVLKSHQEIAAVYGNLPAGTQPPAQYDFPAGL